MFFKYALYNQGIWQVMPCRENTVALYYSAKQLVKIVRNRQSSFRPIGTTRPIPPNRRSCLGCIWWKDMSNTKRLR